jgi:hypothetical protein
VKKLNEFSTPPKAGFEEYADGNVYRAVQGEDYDNRRSFLAALTRWAGQNAFTVERIVLSGDETESVEFRFVKADALVAEAEAARAEKTEDPF